jgi:hypothetical protein
MPAGSISRWFLLLSLLPALSGCRTGGAVSPPTAKKIWCVTGVASYRTPDGGVSVPLANARITLWCPLRGEAVAETRTDAKGRYRIQTGTSTDRPQLQVWGMRFLNQVNYLCTATVEAPMPAAAAQKADGCFRLDVVTDCREFIPTSPYR